MVEPPRSYPLPDAEGRVLLTEDEWRGRLSKEEYRVLRKQGTDRPFTGDLWNEKRSGRYLCAGCGLELFTSTTKFDSGTGWPSFYAVVDKARVGERSDNSLFMRRVEIVCNRCGGHLGHVFNDGPRPTGLRYCVNTAALDFVTDATVPKAKRDATHD